MARDTITDLLAFLAVAREQSFTRAAAKMGVSQSALSHTIKELETRLGVRLLTRTTRSVSPTETGERLLRTIAPRFERISSALAAVSELSEKPSGSLRITASDYAATTVLHPKLAPLLSDYPDLQVEMNITYGLGDVVADGYDIGVRWGDQVARGTIAVRIGPDCRMVIVGAPSYLASRTSPKSPEDLLSQKCINLRAANGEISAWQLKRGGRQMQVRVDGQATFNGIFQALNAALSGGGLAYVPEDLVSAHVAEGRLAYVLDRWFPSLPGLHLYYPFDRQSSRTLSVVVEALRHTA